MPGPRLIPLGLLMWASACHTGTASWVDHARSTPAAALDAYESAARHDGANLDRLRAIAAGMLEKASRNGPPRTRETALHQLELAGTRARPVWQRLARDAPLPTRAKAWALLARLGDDDATAQLQALETTDAPRARAIRLRALKATLPLEELSNALHSSYAIERAAAAEALTAKAPDDSARRALAAAARVDPERSVRVRATRALGHFGAKAAGVLRERLTADAEPVRHAAMGALLRADIAAGMAALSDMVQGAVAPSGIHAALHLLKNARDEARDATVRRDARRYLERALGASEVKLRSRAAVGMDGIPITAWAARALEQRLTAEREASVRLALASALVDAPSYETRAVDALRGLIDHPGMPGLQAAVALSRRARSAAAAERILLDLSSESPASRRVSARATALYLHRPHRARTALRDPDTSVRLATAGAILASDAPRDG